MCECVHSDLLYSLTLIEFHVCIATPQTERQRLDSGESGSSPTWHLIDSLKIAARREWQIWLNSAAVERPLSASLSSEAFREVSGKLSFCAVVVLLLLLNAHHWKLIHLLFVCCCSILYKVNPHTHTQLFGN